MREIKFRAWNGKKLIYGPTDDNNSPSWILAFCAGTNIEPEQYTGLKDKNGKEIYEGDILYFDIQDYNGIDHFNKSFVEYAGSGFGVSYNKADRFIELDLVMLNDDEVEVIGNIHENPELLDTL